MVRASLIWLNHNSSGFIDVAPRSVESALRLDFDDYEVVIVDNASSDGSFEMIRKFVEEKSQVVLGLSPLGAMRIEAMQRHEPRLGSKRSGG